MQIDETVHGCPVGRRCGSPDRQLGDPGSPSQIRTTSGQPPLVAAGRLRYEKLYCARGQAENHIKSWKTHLCADRTSCHKATANQFRLFLHAGADWLLWSMRALMPRRSRWRVAQFDTLRLRLIKLAALIVETRRQILVHGLGQFPRQVCRVWQVDSGAF